MGGKIRRVTRTSKLNNMNREDMLLKVLQFDSQYERVFTTFERIYIQYERAKILQDEEFTQPEKLEKKINDVFMRTLRIKWKPYN